MQEIILDNNKFTTKFGDYPRIIKTKIVYKF